MAAAVALACVWAWQWGGAGAGVGAITSSAGLGQGGRYGPLARTRMVIWNTQRFCCPQVCGCGNGVTLAWRRVMVALLLNGGMA